MTITGVEGILVDYMNTNIASLTTGTNLFEGQERPTDRNTGGLTEAVFVNDSLTGGVDQPYCDGGSGTNIGKRDVQILVRGGSGPGSRRAAKVLASEIYELLRKAVISGLIGVEPASGFPKDWGEDSTGISRFTVNLTVYIRE